ncbi:MAG: 16S rRNA (cytosine(967)-C(5))-methyltransferase RsmB [Gallionellaceae bacterium]|jgi:16S rRNA (cytosine967-C5)-methyltransferase|nr:16S rRNA (cytosine(967)-C(5))-methyltransferase RsmB [Gallionellaceae bacterium]
MHTIQHLASRIVCQVLNGRNLNQELDTTLRGETLSPQQRGALQDLCYGTLRYYGQLAQVLKQLLHKPLKDARLRCLLLVALYQLESDRAAPYAVVDHAVRAARGLNAAAGGLVNAVLRNFLRRREELLAVAASHDEGRYSHPQWWIDALREQYGERADAILQAGNQHPPMTLRVNIRRATPAAYLALLAEQNIEARLIEPDALLLARPLPVDKLPGFFDGLVSVQDAGAQYAALLLDAQDGMRVLDACAAPGGKTAHLLERAQLDLLALDKDEQRLERVRENLQRLNLTAQLHCGDAAQPDTWWDGKPFQRILADVPCSASGVVRRHPDIKWLRRPEDIAGFARQQSQILTALWRLLAKDGKLLYATCSVFARENQQVVDAFLRQHSDAQQLPIEGLPDSQLLPDERHDGFFYALLYKSA